MLNGTKDLVVGSFGYKTCPLGISSSTVFPSQPDVGYEHQGIVVAKRISMTEPLFAKLGLWTFSQEPLSSGCSSSHCSGFELSKHGFPTASHSSGTLVTFW